MVQNLPANAGDIRDLVGCDPCVGILAWRIAWTEEPGGLLVHSIAQSWT